jgi:nucleoside-diphosphate-sugar epimerase
MDAFLPSIVENEEHLDGLLSDPSEAAIESLRQTKGDILLLGVGGKMGLSLATMARRAADLAGAACRVIGVSRFSDASVQQQLNKVGVETIRGDLLDAQFVNSLPDAANIVHMTGMKFGTSARPSATWATNVLMPSLVCTRFRNSRIVAFSTGNVYPLVPLESGGSKETDPCGPIGEYAMTALGRERIFEHFSHTLAMPISMIRLNYAVEMRYGVLVDIAQHVWNETEIDVSMGFVNVIWQGDACAMSLAALQHASSPPFIVNVCGSEFLSVRDVADEFGRLMDKPTRCVGKEADTALLSDGALAFERYGRPRVSVERLMQWITEWVRNGGRTLGKPTHFQVRSGSF